MSDKRIYSWECDSRKGTVLANSMNDAAYAVKDVLTDGEGGWIAFLKRGTTSVYGEAILEHLDGRNKLLILTATLLD